MRGALLKCGAAVVLLELLCATGADADAFPSWLLASASPKPIPSATAAINPKNILMNTDLSNQTILPSFGCGALPQIYATFGAGRSSFPEPVAVARTLRQCSSGILAIMIKASWLIMNPSNHGNAFCMKP